MILVEIEKLGVSALTDYTDSRSLRSNYCAGEVHCAVVRMQGRTGLTWVTLMQGRVG